MSNAFPTQLIDRFDRQVTYVRLSVTDRCDFRCVYCMAEDMTFLPRDRILSLEEMALIGQAFTELGVEKIRLTGGEPLIRQGITHLVETLKSNPGLKTLAMTSNGSQLPSLAEPLINAGLDRLNISLDSLKPERFRQLTRTGSLKKVLTGISAAQAAGFKNIKINAVILKGRNDDEVIDLINFARDQQLDISFIEEMPLGDIGARDRGESYCSSDELRDIISAVYPLTANQVSTGGPSKYFAMQDSQTQVGFISPHSHNFCGDCNRVRVTAEGRLLLCLGNEHSLDLRAVCRSNPGQLEPIKAAIVNAMALKPEKHEFDLNAAPQIVRFMNMTGG